MNELKTNRQFKKKFKRGAHKLSLLLFPLLFVILLHMPFVFASGLNQGTLVHLTQTENHLGAKPVERKNIGEAAVIDSMYDIMELNTLGLSEKVFSYAIKGFNYLQQKGSLAKNNIISIADFSMPSSKKRLFVIDLNEDQVLFNTYVAHGVNSGKEYAKQFSNQPSSYKTSLGFYETQSTYLGSNGYSLRLEGLEKGINDNANKRDIVIHGADYANESLVKAQGYLGRSWGCPALPEKLSKPIIDKIKNGSCFFIYSSKTSYLQKSKIING